MTICFEAASQVLAWKLKTLVGFDTSTSCEPAQIGKLQLAWKHNAGLVATGVEDINGVMIMGIGSQKLRRTCEL